MPTPPKRPAALVRAEHDRPAVKLDASQRQLLAEALRRGEDLREEVEAKVTSYGRWLLAAVFANDAAAALDGRTQNPVWLELVRRAGGPTLGVSRRLLYVAVQIAARDKRITDQAWRGLDSVRKEILLPLADDDRLREAAQQVSKFNLTQPKTRALVATMLRAQGKPRQVRLTGPRLAAQVKKVRAGFDRPGVLKRIGELRAQLTPTERAAVAEEIEALKASLTKMVKALRG